MDIWDVSDVTSLTTLFASQGCAEEQKKKKKWDKKAFSNSKAQHKKKAAIPIELMETNKGNLAYVYLFPTRHSVSSAVGRNLVLE